MKGFIKSIVMSLAVIGVAAASPYAFNGVSVDVETILGGGANETILVVDWNRFDHGLDTITESHAFVYRWDGDKTIADMLADFDAADILDVTFTYGGAAAGFISYFDGVENHFHDPIEESSWNSASTTNPFARWGSWGDSDWEWNNGGIDTEWLVNGQFEGINAVSYYLNPVPDYIDTQLDIPLVPEPASLSLLALGGAGLLRRRR